MRLVYYPTEAVVQTINSMWVGNPLGSSELLTLKSFLAHGHRFVLWVYGGVEVPIDHDNLRVENASSVLPESRVFRYRGGPYPGSYAGFSDVFRYELLASAGGWWVDMDVVCLRHFDIEEQYCFRPTIVPGVPVIGNILKCPPGSELMEYCRQAVRGLDEHNEDWHGPVRPLCEGIERFGLQAHVVPESWFGVDSEEQCHRYRSGVATPPAGQYALHWCNEWCRALGLAQPQPGTFFWRQLEQYGLLDGTFAPA